MDLRRRLGPLERLRGAPCAAWRSPRAVLLVTGPGAEAARRAVAWLLGGGVGGRPARVLSAGFCGGLVPECPAGAVVWPGRVVGEDGTELPLEAAPGRRLLSVAAPVAGSRQRLAERYGACVVDMETA